MRYRGKAFCRKSAGSVCASHVDPNAMYYYKSKNNTDMEERLKKPIELISSRLSDKCRTIALQAICYRFYPQCKNASPPTPVNVCKDECQTIISGDCADDFNDAHLTKYLRRVIPSCYENSDDDEEDSEENDGKCIQLEEGRLI